MLEVEENIWKGKQDNNDKLVRAIYEDKYESLFKSYGSQDGYVGENSVK